MASNFQTEIYSFEKALYHKSRWCVCSLDSFLHGKYKDFETMFLCGYLECDRNIKDDINLSIYIINQNYQKAFENTSSADQIFDVTAPVDDKKTLARITANIKSTNQFTFPQKSDLIFINYCVKIVGCNIYNLINFIFLLYLWGLKNQTFDSDFMFGTIFKEFIKGRKVERDKKLLTKTRLKDIENFDSVLETMTREYESKLLALYNSTTIKTENDHEKFQKKAEFLEKLFVYKFNYTDTILLELIEIYETSGTLENSKPSQNLREKIKCVLNAKLYFLSRYYTDDPLFSKQIEWKKLGAFYVIKCHAEISLNCGCKSVSDDNSKK